MLVPFGRAAGRFRFDGEGDLDNEGTVSLPSCNRFVGEGDLANEGVAPLPACNLGATAVLTLRRLELAGVKPNPAAAVFDTGFALAGPFFAGDVGLVLALGKYPSLVPGLL